MDEAFYTFGTCKKCKNDQFKGQQLICHCHGFCWKCRKEEMTECRARYFRYKNLESKEE